MPEDKKQIPVLRLSESKKAAILTIGQDKFITSRVYLKSFLSGKLKYLYFNHKI